MKRKTNLIFGVVLALAVMLFGGQTVSAETEGVLTYDISAGEVTITDCDTSVSGELVIPETIEGYPVTRIGSFAFGECSGLTGVEISNNVKNIEHYAFEGCINLANIELPDAIANVESSSFYNKNYYNNSNNWEQGVFYI